jgi:RIO-like serine/threonine protein kinase
MHEEFKKVKWLVKPDRSLLHKFNMYREELSQDDFPENVPNWEQLGEGAAGNVYRKEDDNYVVKIQKANNLFYAEVKCLKDLQNKVSVVPKLYAAWIYEEKGYIIIEKLNVLYGMKSDKMEKALEEIFNYGWLHLDISTCNRMCNSDGNLILIDFGWAVKKPKNLEQTYPKHPISIQACKAFTYTELKARQDFDFTLIYGKNLKRNTKKYTQQIVQKSEHEPDTFCFPTKKEFIEAVKDFNRKKRLSFLKTCPSSSFCLAFGKESKKIKSLFNGFKFDYVDRSSISNFRNNLLFIIGYKRIYEGINYEASIVLKTVQNQHSDNLLYEYMVGQYINKQSLRFPCFIETYHWLTYKRSKDLAMWIKNKNLKELFNDSNQSFIEASTNKHKRLDCTDNKKDSGVKRICSDVELLFTWSCMHARYLAITIQYIKGAKRLDDMLKIDGFIDNDLINVLYQIYMPLSTIANEFTHYDLHKGNVVIYEPKKGYYIDYRYILNDKTIVEFKSRYIAKIIDYGRSFFDDPTNQDATGSSKSIKKIICENVLYSNSFNRETKTNFFCGEDFGYYFTPIVSDQTRDLILLEGMSLPEIFTKITNVSDAHNVLKDIIQTETEKLKNDSVYDDMRSLGRLTIYESGKEMKFVQEDDFVP